MSQKIQIQFNNANANLSTVLQVNETGIQLQPTTEPITVKTRVLSTTNMETLRKGGERPTSGDKLHSTGVFVATEAVIKQQRSVVEMGVAGSLYLWFSFIKGNVFLAKDVCLSFGKYFISSIVTVLLLKLLERACR